MLKSRLAKLDFDIHFLTITPNRAKIKGIISPRTHFISRIMGNPAKKGKKHKKNPGERSNSGEKEK
jgi:hypothetical protein